MNSHIKLLEQYWELEVLQNMKRSYESMNTKDKKTLKIIEEVNEAIDRLLNKELWKTL